MRTVVFLLFCLAVPQTLTGSSDEAQYWPQWRGWDTTGVAKNGAPPITWSEDQNVRWKIPISGFGLATPVVWGDYLYLLTAVKTQKKATVKEPAEGTDSARRARFNPKVADHYYQFQLQAIHRKSGKVAWTQTAIEALPHESTHADGSWAAHSAVTDGNRILAYFGSAGLFCYTMEGKLLWQTDFGDMRTRNGFGEGSSPAIYDDKAVVNWDHEDQSFIVALHMKTGETLWKKDRDEPTSWSTPVIVEVDGKPQVIVNATNKVRGYDLQSGDVIWEFGGMTLNTIPTPIVSQGTLYVASGFRGNAARAVKLSGAKGDLTGTDHILWSYDRDTPYVPSMLLYDNLLYVVKTNKGILSCLDAKTGKPHYGPVRLEGISGIYASPVGAKDHVYVVGRGGTSVVLKKGTEFQVVATNKLDDRFDASPVIVGRELYLRGHKSLYCIAVP